MTEPHRQKLATAGLIAFALIVAATLGLYAGWVIAVRGHR